MRVTDANRFDYNTDEPKSYIIQDLISNVRFQTVGIIRTVYENGNGYYGYCDSLAAIPNQIATMNLFWE
jgi:hypothetical protein